MATNNRRKEIRGGEINIKLSKHDSVTLATL